MSNQNETTQPNTNTKRNPDGVLYIRTDRNGKEYFVGTLFSSDSEITRFKAYRNTKPPKNGKPKHDFNIFFSETIARVNYGKTVGEDYSGEYQD